MGGIWGCCWHFLKQISYWGNGWLGPEQHCAVTFPSWNRKGKADSLGSLSFCTRPSQLRFLFQWFALRARKQSANSPGKSSFTFGQQQILSPVSQNHRIMEPSELGWTHKDCRAWLLILHRTAQGSHPVPKSFVQTLLDLCARYFACSYRKDPLLCFYYQL